MLAEPPFVDALDAARTAGFTASEWDAYILAGIAIQNERGALAVARKLGREDGLREGREDRAGATWEHYELELAIRGKTAVPRLAYLEGALELRSPSREHQRITSYLGRLIEVYAEHADIELSPYRSWTLKNGQTAGGEPDECYIIGADQAKDRPDLVIEVIWTSGGIDKLAIYERLGIDEVWFWIAGSFVSHPSPIPRLLSSVVTSRSHTLQAHFRRKYPTTRCGVGPRQVAHCVSDAQSTALSRRRHTRRAGTVGARP